MQPGEIAGLKPADQQRRIFGNALRDVCRSNANVVVLDGDLGNSTGTHEMRKDFPDRFYNIGIAESNLVGVGAGLAACGYIPFITSLSSFLLCNAFDQIRLSISIAGLNAKFVGSHSGLSTGREGPSSMSIEDYALAAALPPFVILVPSDPATMNAAVRAAAEHRGPVYIRSSREPFPHVYADGKCSFAIGKANRVREGRDATIVACGLMVAVALDAAVLLARQGVQVRVLDMHTLRPLDTAELVSAARETGAVITAEEHLIRGGLGSSVARVLAETHPVPMRFVGLDDTYTGSGSIGELMVKHRMTAEDIAARVCETIAGKKGRAA
jgi:transketolase